MIKEKLHFNDQRETSLLAKVDALKLGIVKLNLKGSSETVISELEYIPKSSTVSQSSISGGESPEEIDKNMKRS